MTMTYAKERIQTEPLGSTLCARIGKDGIRKQKVALPFLVILLLGCAVMQDMGVVFSTSGATIYVEPSTSSALIGETFNVDIAVTGIPNLYGWDILIHFDPTILDATSLTRGHFFEKAGYWTEWQLAELFGQPYGVINNTAGYIIIDDIFSLPQPPSGVTGSGTLLTINFTVKDVGATLLMFDEDMTKLLTKVGENVVSIPHETVDGFFNNFSPPTPPDTNASRVCDVAITYVKVDRHSAPQGEPIYMNVTVENQGSENETFDVTVTASRHNSDVVIHVETQTVYDLPPEASEILNIVWNTTDTPYGSYDVISEAVLPEDEDPEDNFFRTYIGGITVPHAEIKTSLLAYLMKLAPTILGILALGMAGLGFIKILGWERVEWPFRLRGRDT